ncbi:hypothetical protein LU293_07025 [Moraxella nasovis]|uniref:hypothetical protein n=1 Tax=Moraxella nasovis TaxID=2904121 RepID=UPI001F625CB2|nr:hypothetical protein [Moraxella nasovis]UNU72844.1 hypothetical protein LU293_07025 [Moraxella nasovis]
MSYLSTNKDFYLYQLSETLLNTTIKTIGIVFAWLMINTLHLSQPLGVFISISWACQVVFLLLFSYLSSKRHLNHKKLLLVFCGLSSLGLAVLFRHDNHLIFGIIFIITSIFFYHFNSHRHKPCERAVPR